MKHAKHKLTAFLLVFTMLISLITPTSFQARERKADYGTNDAMSILKYLAGIEAVDDNEFVALDMDCNNQLDISDALTILMYMSKMVFIPNCVCAEDATAAPLPILTTPPLLTTSPPPTTVPPETTTPPVVTSPEDTTTTTNITTTVSDVTTPQVSSDTPDPTGTTPPITNEPTPQTTTGTTQQEGDRTEIVLYDMQEDNELAGHAGPGNLPNSFTWLKSNFGEGASISVSGSPLTVVTNGRGGNGQGFNIKLDTLKPLVKANHDYRFDVTGSVGTTVKGSAILRFGTTSSSPAVVTNGGSSTVTIGAGGAFNMGAQVSAAAISAVAAESFYTIGTVDNNADITLTTLKIVQLCPEGCTTCTVPVKYTVTFDNNYPNAPAAITRQTGNDGKFTALPSPAARDGFSFAGWYSAAVGGNAITTATVFTSAEVVYAHWEEAGATNTLYDLKADTLLESFLDDTHPILANQREAVSLAVNAAAKTLTVNTEGSSSSGLDLRLSGLGVKANHGYTFNMTASLTKAGTLKLQSVHSTKRGKTGSSTTPEPGTGSGLTLKELMSQSVATTPTTFTYSMSAVDVAALAAAGEEIRVIRFAGISSNTLTVSDLTVTLDCPAGCTDCFERTITFDAQGGIGSPTTAKTDVFGRLFSLPTPTREGYFFKGWYTTATGDEKVTTATLHPTTRTIYAQWTSEGDFAGLTAAMLVNNMGTGWNLGNTFDSHDTTGTTNIGSGLNTGITQLETYWISGQANVTTQKLIQEVKKQGFDTIRIPVTWYKVVDNATDVKVRDAWLTRIKTVVDWAIAEDMYVIINSHHDEKLWWNGTGGRSDADNIASLSTLWTNVGTYFNDYDQHLIFEGINEPRKFLGGKDEHGNENLTKFEPNAQEGASEGWFDMVNKLNQAFVTAVRDSGGKNGYRILMVPTYAANSGNGPLGGFVKPTDKATDKLILSIHRYEPTGFTLFNDTKEWSESGIRTRLTAVKDRATALGMPVILGEWGVTNNNKISDSETARTTERAKYSNAYMRIATDLGMRCIWWDNGRGGKDQNGSEVGGLFSRSSQTLYDGYDLIIKAIMAGRKGSSTYS